MATHSTHPLAAGKLPGDLLARLIESYRSVPDDAVIVEASYGFDAAAVRIGGETLIVKSDPITFTTENAAHYLVAVNANDIACLGGIPRWMTVVALLPENQTTTETVEALFADLQAACTTAGITILGGHTEITLRLDRPLLIGTMLGLTGPEGLLLPGNASNGDDLYVTKTIGLEGTSILASECADDLRQVLTGEDLRNAARLIHEPGISVTHDARIALATGLVTALHDPTEGGLATAVHEISEASGLGAKITRDLIPIRQDTNEICRHYGIDPLGLLSSGALLIAAKPGSHEALDQAFTGSGIAITHIGHLTSAESGHTLVQGEDILTLPRYDADELTKAFASGETTNDN